MDTINARRYQLIELQVLTALSASQQLYFQDQPQLRSQPDQLVVINAIEAYNVDTIAKAPSGRATVAVADLANAYLVLNIAGTDEMKYIPLNRLNPVQDGTNPSTFSPLILDQLTQVDWTKSYIQAVDTVAAGLSFLFGVFYRYQPMQVR